MKTLDAVFSGPHHLRLSKFGWADRRPDQYDVLVKKVNQGIQKVKAECHKILPEFNVNISLLYNGYTEDKAGRWISSHDFGFNSMYADSGGLQALTLGEDITDDVRKQIYQSQTNSDFAMSFDDIPATTTSKEVRATNKSKIYYPERAKECAIKSASYLKEQIEYFDKVGAKTKAFLITQGNNVDDILHWYDAAFSVLEPAHIKRVGGIATAFSCLGVGMQERVINQLAYSRIMAEYNPDIPYHLHMLGLGSVKPMFPSLCWLMSPLCNPNQTFSYDSTSASMVATNGIFYFKHCGWKKYTHLREATIVFDEMFAFCYDDILADIGVDYDTLYTHLINNRMSVSKTTNIESDEPIYLASRVFNAILPFYQLITQYQHKRKELEEASGIYAELKSISEITDFTEWFNKYSHKLKSQRVARADTAYTVNDFWS